MVNRIVGTASGLDIDKIVSDLMKSEKIPQDTIYQKQQWATYQRDSYREMNLAIDTFRKSVDNLRFQSTFNAYSAISSNTNSFTASSTSNSVPGTYSVVVNSTASVANMITAQPITNGTNKVKSTDKILNPGVTSQIEIQTISGVATIDIDENTTYASLASKIAGASDASGASLGIRAMFDEATSSFVISSKDSGANQSIKLTDKTGNVASLISTGGDSSNAGAITGGFSKTIQGTDASVDITSGGVTSNVTSSTNNISVFGLKINVSNTGSGTISVKSDSDAVFNTIKNFVDAYNSIIDKVNTKLNEDRYRDYPPLTKDQRNAMSENDAKLWDEKAKSGTLTRDPLLNDVMSTLRQYMSAPVTGIASNELNSLSKIGITTQYMSLDGKLQIDETKLRNAINNNPDQVMNLFTISDPNADPSKKPPVPADKNKEGIGERLYDILNDAVSKLKEKAGAPNTSDSLDTSILGKSISDYANQYNDWTDKLQDLETRYYNQFNAMDAAIQKLNSQVSYITSALGGGR
ncbi:flagellar filament capping protein FliD [Margalitia sp. FSL K6-0131]|uniref:flagellar filament capping protein FliD n=1 Tax=Margalitia sp. FSL K6-0131 TaxID=2954604 RepID=UPI0030FCCD32